MTARVRLGPLTGGLLATTLLASPAWGEAALDGTTGSTGSFSGDFEIPAEVGRRAGPNLFHSFERFHVRQGESATFTGPAGIDNVISRVTGNEASTIDGLLRSTVPGADFWFLNPRGVVFGPDASLDLPGSFHVSTADEFRFSDGSVFSATDPGAGSFTIAAPEAFGFLGDTPGSILVDRGRVVVGAGETLDLSAGAIAVSGGNAGGSAGTLEAPGGQVLLTTVSGPGEVRVDDAGSGTPGGGAILVADRASVATDGAGGGRIRIRSGSFQIDHLSSVTATNTAAGDAAGGIAVDAQSVGVRGQSLLLTRTTGEGAAGDVVVRSGELQVESGSIVGSVSLAAGTAGAVQIEAQRVSVAGGARINSDAVGSGSAGPVTIAADEVAITDNGQIRSSTFGAGDAGPIAIAGAHLLLRDGNEDAIPTGILSDADIGSSGNAGAISVRAERIEVLVGAQIRALTFASGNAGVVDIATGDLTLDAKGATALLTAISSSAAPGASGSAGAVQIVADGTVRLLDGAQIRSQTFGPGTAGAVAVTADDLLIRDANADDSPTGILSDAEEGSTGDAGAVLVNARTIRLEAGGQIRSVTFGEGNAGAVGIEAEHLVVTADGQSAIVTGVLSSAEPGSSGDAGAIFLDVERIELLAGGQIRALTFSSGDAGRIGIQTRDLTISGQGFTALPTGILSNAEINSSGDGGTILLLAEGTVEVTDGQINTSSSGFGEPGDILLDVGRLTLAEGGVIGSLAAGPIPTADDVEGGDIEIIARDRIILSGTLEQPSGISADTASSRNAGSIRIQAPVLRVESAVVSSSTLGFGNAGSIILEVGRLFTGPSGAIASASPNLSGPDLPGSSGSITIFADDRIELTGDAEQNVTGGVTTSTATRGPAGSIIIKTPLLRVAKAGQISSATTGFGMGGSIVIHADRIELDDSGVIGTSSLSADPAAGVAGGIRLVGDSLRIRGNASVSAETAAAEAGDIEISADRLVELRRGAVTTSVAGGLGSGGNIQIDPEFVVVDGSQIVANALEGAGGNIRIVADNFFRTPDSRIDASSELGIDGTVEVTTPDLDLTSELAVLPTAYIDVSGLLRNSCTARASDQISSFTFAGGRGLAPDPSTPLAGRYGQGAGSPTPAAFHEVLATRDHCDD